MIPISDNVAITAGSGTNIRTLDNGSGYQKQVMALDVGGESAESLVTAANPVPVYSPASVAIQAVLATTATPYAAGDAIGTGALTLANAVRANGGMGVIQSINVNDGTHQNAAFDILLFNATPTTGPADNAAYSLSATDYTSQFAKISVPATAYTTYGTCSVATIGGLGIVIKAGASVTSIYAVAVCQGTPTYTANCVEITLGILRD